MNKTFKELGFKAGDTVVCLRSNLEFAYQEGDEFVLKEIYGELVTDCSAWWSGNHGDWKPKTND